MRKFLHYGQTHKPLMSFLRKQESSFFRVHTPQKSTRIEVPNM